MTQITQIGSRGCRPTQPQRSSGWTRFRRATRWGRGTGVCLLLLLLLTSLYFWFSTPLPDLNALRARAARGDTRILDRQGRLLQAIADPQTGHRQPVPLGAIPLALRQATIAVEDADFATNSGVEPRGMLRALWANVRHAGVVAGGSTITQQLVRTSLLDPQLASERSLTRKAREIVLALKLTRALPKDEILELYLNQSYYGGLSYGVGAAAQRVFGKPVQSLDLAECALLAGLPQAPSAYDPHTDLPAARARQAQVLAAMRRTGAITADDAAAALNEPLQLAQQPDPANAPHFVAYVLAQLTAQLGTDAVQRGGLTVTTTLDLDLQTAAEAALRHQLALLNAPPPGSAPHNAQNGAVVVLDPADGALLALVGSPDPAEQRSGQVNAALALRQPGSAIKPLTYAAALERGWTPATRILDAPVSFATGEGGSYAPQNYDRAFHGWLTLREALATSSNVAAVQTLSQIGVPALLEIAQRLGVRSLDQQRNSAGLALTLGGGEVTPLELTAAYAAFANGGRPITSYAVIAAAGADGAGLWASRPGAPAGRLAPEVAYLITDMLADRYARMRSFGESSALDLDRPAAAKTGTTTDWRDNWTVGYTPDRVVGVWVGNASGAPMAHVSGISGAAPVWQAVMRAAHRGLPPRPFPRPAGIVERLVCADGQPLTAGCAERRVELFWEASSASPEKAAGTSPQSIVRTQRAAFPQVTKAGDRPDQAQDDGVTQPDVSSDSAPQIVSPEPGSTYTISRRVPLDAQQIVVRAAALGAQRIVLLVDGVALTAEPGRADRALWQLAPGEHTVQVEIIDARGVRRRSAAVRFTVVE